MKREGPYVGVTGFMSIGEIDECSRFFKQAVNVHLVNHPSQRDFKFMVGILVSSKTLSGGTNKWPGRYPSVDNLRELMRHGDDEHLLQTVHYNTDDPMTIEDQIAEVVRVSGPNLHAIQLNMRWVSPVLLQRVRRRYGYNLRIILQIGTEALKDVAEEGEGDIFLGQALRSYEGVVDDFLVDPSGGKGEPLDVWKAFACLSDKDIPSGMRPGMAGGFAKDNVGTVRGVIRRLGPVNLDAEGRLRSSKEEGDFLLIPKAYGYIIEAVRVQRQ